MIKIIHFSDIHWRGLKRHDEYVDAFEQMFKILKKDIKPDIILCTGDIWHTKTQGITPEAIEKIAWMFKECAKIAPLHIILGNHDGNLANNSRQDAITPIIEAINSPEIFLYKNSGNYIVEKHPQINFCVFSCFDEEGWIKVKPLSDKINIALYHGSITGCLTDTDWRMTHGEKNMEFFNDYDLCLMGDIHKRQFLGHKIHSGVTRDLKPWIGYPGSFIQQNFGEDEEKGFLVWEVGEKTNDLLDWNVEFYPLENKIPYLSIPWEGSVASTIKTVEDIRGKEDAFPKKSRIRVLSNENISQLEMRKLTSFLRDNKECSEIVFKVDNANNLDSISTNMVSTAKANLRNPDTLALLYKEYVQAHLMKLGGLTDVQFEKGKELIKGYLAKLKEQEPEEPIRDTSWSIKNLYFSNLFRYGENNSINFQKLNGIVGIFGQNRVGKSSIASALSYGLFNTTEREVGKATGNYINKNKKQASCRVEFSTNNGNNYVVERVVSLKEGNKDPLATTTNLSISRIDKDGRLIPLGKENDISRNDTDKAIRTLIGSPLDFRLTSFSSQGDITRFIDQGATSRKATLNRFLDLDLFEKLFKFASEDRAKINAKTISLSSQDFESTLLSINNSKEKLESELESVVARLKEIDPKIILQEEWLKNNKVDHILANKNKRKKLEVEIENLSYTEINDCNINNSVISMRLEGKKITKLEIESKINPDERKRIVDKLNEINLSKQKLQDLNVLIKLNDSTLTSMQKSVSKLETVPCGNCYPNCRFIKDSHEDKLKLPSLTEDLITLKLKKDVLSSSFKDDSFSLQKQLENYDKNEKELPYVNLAISKLELELMENKTKKEKLQFLLTQKQQELSSLPPLTEGTKEEELIEIYEKTQLILSSLLKEKQNLESKKMSIWKDIGKFEAKKELLLYEKEQTKKYIDEIEILDSVEEAFSKNGIPAMVLKTQLPALNNELSKILTGVVDFKLVFETEVASNSLDIYIEDSSSRRIIELCSGMEKMIASLAIRVALYNLTSLPKPDIFIIDEGFGVLDADSIESCLQFLSSLRNQFKTLLIISHISQIKEIVDHVLEIENNGTESKINFPTIQLQTR